MLGLQNKNDTTLICEKVSLSHHDTQTLPKARWDIELVGMEYRLSSESYSVVTNDTRWIDPSGRPNLVSIVLPTRNRALLLQETLESLVQQSYRPLEIVVVGDGTRDNTADIIAQAKVAAGDGIDIKYLRQDRSGGPAARNLGAQHTTGEYMVFMDDDDIAAEDFIASRVDALRGTDANLANGTWQTFVVDEKGKHHLLEPKGKHCLSNEGVWESFLSNWDLLLQGCVLRRELVSKVGPWHVGLHKSQDLDYKARLVAQDCRPVYCDRGLVFYRLHDDSISGQLDAVKLDSYVEVLEQIEHLGVNRSDYQQTKKVLADYFWSHAFWLYGLGDFARGYRELQRAKKHSPQICRSKGVIARVLDRLGFDISIGPAYYFSSQIKKTLGLSRRKFSETKEELPVRAK